MAGWKNKKKLYTYLSVCFFCLACLILLGSYVSAAASILKIDPDIEFVLPAYNTSIGQSGYLYCDSFAWNDSNATDISFDRVFMTSGYPVDNLDVSVQNGNLTFNELGSSYANLDLANFGSAATLQLTGFGSEPTQIEIDGTLIDNYTYTDSLDLLSIETEGTTVSLSFISGLTVDDAIAVAIIIAVALFAASFALIYKVRKNNE